MTDMKTQGTNLLLGVILVSGIAIYGGAIMAVNNTATSDTYFDLAEHQLEQASENLRKANELLAQEQHNAQQ